MAILYGVEAKRVKEAVKNNSNKFPNDYMFELADEDVTILRSKIPTTKVSTKNRSSTKVLTEKGQYMLATILKSKQATGVTFAIIRIYRHPRLKAMHMLSSPHSET